MTKHGWAECNWGKACMGIPAVVALAIITYISVSFYVNWIPAYFGANRFQGLALLIQVVFGYFSLMTYVFLFVTLTMDPGYLPDYLKAPLKQDKKPPLELVRIYNIRQWRLNQIKDFESFFTDLEAPGGNGEQEDTASSNADVDFSVETADNTSIDDSRLLEAANKDDKKAIEMKALDGSDGASKMPVKVDIDNINSETYFKVDVNNLTPLE